MDEQLAEATFGNRWKGVAKVDSEIQQSNTLQFFSLLKLCIVNRPEKSKDMAKHLEEIKHDE